MSIFTEESKKCNLGENAIIFDEMGKRQEVSSVGYCRYNFLIKSWGWGRQPVHSAFTVLTAEVAKVI